MTALTTLCVKTAARQLPHFRLSCTKIYLGSADRVWILLSLQIHVISRQPDRLLRSLRNPCLGAVSLQKESINIVFQDPCDLISYYSVTYFQRVRRKPGK